MSRHVRFEKLHNFRDIGGYAADDGRTVRWNRLYRADALSKLHGADLDRFNELGVKTVIDLRYPFEIADHGRVPEAAGVNYYNCSVEHRPYDQVTLSPDVPPARFFADRYAECLEDGAKEFRQALEVIADPAAAPIVFHCKTGKDRTGLIAALVLHLLGVGEDDIVADFALTNLATEQFIADFKASGQTPQWPGYGAAPADAMRFCLAELAQAYGSVRGYIRFLGMDDEQLTASLRELYLT